MCSAHVTVRTRVTPPVIEHSLLQPPRRTHTPPTPPTPISTKPPPRRWLPGWRMDRADRAALVDGLAGASGADAEFCHDLLAMTGWDFGRALDLALGTPAGGAAGTLPAAIAANAANASGKDQKRTTFPAVPPSSDTGFGAVTAAALGALMHSVCWRHRSSSPAPSGRPPPHPALRGDPSMLTAALDMMCGPGALPRVLALAVYDAASPLSDSLLTHLDPDSVPLRAASPHVLLWGCPVEQLSQLSRLTQQCPGLAPHLMLAGVSNSEGSQLPMLALVLPRGFASVSPQFPWGGTHPRRDQAGAACSTSSLALSFVACPALEGRLAVHHILATCTALGAPGPAFFRCQYPHLYSSLEAAAVRADQDAALRRATLQDFRQDQRLRVQESWSPRRPSHNQSPCGEFPKQSAADSNLLPCKHQLHQPLCTGSHEQVKDTGHGPGLAPYASAASLTATNKACGGVAAPAPVDKADVFGNPVVLRCKVPNGEVLQRIFGADSPLSDVYDWMRAYPTLSGNPFELTTAFPATTLPCSAAKLSAFGITRTHTLLAVPCCRNNTTAPQEDDTSVMTAQANRPVVQRSC
eukprot:gene937-2583_t